jgi:NAD kinase/nicotinic acid mononucleotide adenylyltransferase
MLRRNVRSLCYQHAVKPAARIGIFPLHLDPPTVQHCEIFRLLVGKDHACGNPINSKSGGTGTSCSLPVSTLSSWSSSHATERGEGSSLLDIEQLMQQPPSSRDLHLGRLKQNALNDPVSCDAMLRGAKSLEHFEDFERLLNESTLAPFDHLILVPNTKYPVTLRQSIHLAAMSVLATKDLARVHIELKALEHPEKMMSVVYDLVSKYPKSTIIHWLPNVHEMQHWKHFDELARNVPFLLLRPKGWRSASEALNDTHTNGLENVVTSPTQAASNNSSPSAASSSSTMSLLRISDKTRLRSMMPRQWDTSSTPSMMEIIEVPRMSGSYVRQELWEGSTSPTELLTPAVQRYVDSQMLYRDFRKGAFHSRYHHNNATQSGRAKQLVTSAHSGMALVAFQGIIPRLELHYDPNNLLAREQYNKLKPFECLDGRDPDLIVPIGGDGYFMHCVRKHWRRYIPFFGVNAGHVGYLLNDCGVLEELFSAPLKLHHLSMLYVEAEAENATGEKHVLEELAFNDAWVERSSGQTALIRILVNGEERIRRVRGDGVLMSTAAGSTAYAQALGASPVPVGAPLIQLVGSNIVSPAQWRPVHLNQEDIVEFEVVDNFKRPCRGYVDAVDVGTVTRMLVRTSRVAGVQVAFADSCDLQQKLYKMQFPGAR